MTDRTLRLPTEVDLGDITVRDGLQALEHYVPADQKVSLAEDLILAGYRHVEVTNFGHPKFLPQFKDCEEVLDRLLDSERVGPRLKQNGGDTTICTITINERAFNRALEFKAKRGRGPDYVLQMVSTDEHHHKTNSGMSLEEYWKLTERCTKAAHEAGIMMCGTVSTIWGSPMKGSRVTDLRAGVEFSKRYLDLGADYIEQADHDGSADPARVYEYFRMILDPEIMGQWADPKYHLAHFHTTRGMGLANYLAALQAGITKFETTLSGTGGQPANAMDGTLTGGTGKYYHFEHLYSGLVTTEDFVVMCEAMGIKTGIDLRKLLGVGQRFRNEYLRMKPGEHVTLLENAARTTGLSVAELETMAEWSTDLAPLIDKAAKAQAADPAAGEHLRENLAGFIHGVATYLRIRAWAPSRSETILSDLPPSPHLAHLLD
jgi:hydroxymethylglutaryl-CoA lyase